MVENKQDVKYGYNILAEKFGYKEFNKFWFDFHCRINKCCFLSSQLEKNPGQKYASDFTCDTIRLYDNFWLPEEKRSMYLWSLCEYGSHLDRFEKDNIESCQATYEYMLDHKVQLFYLIDTINLKFSEITKEELKNKLLKMTEIKPLEKSISQRLQEGGHDKDQADTVEKILKECEV